MAILAVGDEPESWSNFHTGTLVVQTSYKDAGQRGGIYANATNIWHIDLASGLGEMWLRFKTTRLPTTSTTNPILMFTNTSTGKDALRVFAITNQLRVSYNSSGTTYTVLSEFDFPSPDGNAHTHEVIVYFKRGASGILKIWVDDALLVNLSGTYNTVDTTWNRIRFAGSSTSTSVSLATAFGGVVIADESLHGFQLDHLSPSAAGTYSEWTGSYTSLADVTGAPQIDTATDVNTNATAKRFLASFEDMSAISDCREIFAVQLAARGILETGSTPTTVSYFARLSSTDYTLNSLGLGSSALSYQQLLTVDPSSASWTASNVNAIEFGVTT